ncbi:hypothetical protein Tco_1300991 [Tanacetum coccineum]
MGVRAFKASSHGAFLLGFYFMRLTAISIVKGYDNLKAFEKAEIIRSLAWQLIAFAAMAEASFPCRMHPPSIIILPEHIVHGYRLVIQLKTMTVGTKQILRNVLEGRNKAREAKTVVSNEDWKQFESLNEEAAVTEVLVVAVLEVLEAD